MSFISSSTDGAPYLPAELPRARVLVTVKTYPQPSSRARAGRNRAQERHHRLSAWEPANEADLLDAHRTLMAGLGRRARRLAHPSRRGDGQAGRRACPLTVEFMLGIIVETLATPQVALQVTPQVRRPLQALGGEMDRDRLQTALGLRARKNFRLLYLAPALADGLIEMTIPSKPNSRLQKYRLTPKGQAAKEAANREGQGHAESL